MAGLVPAIYVLLARKTWMPGTRPGMTLEMPCRVLCRLLLRLNELATDQALGDLDRVQRRPLTQVVRNNPHHQPVFDRRILADAADIGRVLAGAFVGRDVAARLALVDHEAAWRAAQDLARFVRRDRLLELDVDRFRMSDKHRHAHAGGGELDLGVENLLG